MIRARLQIAGQLAGWAAVGAGLLLVMLLFDTIIAIRFARHRGDDAVALISCGAALMTALLVLVILAAVPRAVRFPATAGARHRPDPARCR